MAADYKRTEIGEGIFLTEIYDEKFKLNNIRVRFITKLDEKTSGANALVPSLLITSNSEIRSRTELSKRLMGLYGTSMSASWNSLGDYQSVGISASPMADRYTIGGEVISTEVVRLMLLCIFSPDLTDGKFNEKYFALRKQELLDNIAASVNNKRAYGYTKAKSVIFEGEPAAVTELKTEEYVRNITAEGLFEQYEYLLKSAAVEITVCGGGGADEAVEMLKNAFSKIKRENVERISYRQNSPVKAEISSRSEDMKIRQSKMFMAYKSGYEDIYVCKLFSALLGGTAFSKLFMNVREKLSLCYYCSSVYFDLKGTLLIDSGVETENIEKAKAAIEEQLKALQQGDITDEELENTKLYLCGSYRSNYDTAWDTAGWYAAQNTRGTGYSPDEVCSIIKGITREQIIECAKSFEPDSVYILKANGEGSDDE